jgi:hypothetical protein
MPASPLSKHKLPLLSAAASSAADSCRMIAARPTNGRSSWDGAAIGCADYLYLSDEAIAVPAHRLDKASAVGLITQCFACTIDCPRHRHSVELRAAPKRIDQLLLADHPIAVLDQITQDSEHTSLERHAQAFPAQLASSKIELERSE